MGKIKSQMMQAQDELFEIFDIEDVISGCESFEEFAGTLMTEGGLAYYDWAYKFGLELERFVITDLWNEFWAEYA